MLPVGFGRGKAYAVVLREEQTGKFRALYGAKRKGVPG
jgi:hypothetical protein